MGVFYSAYTNLRRLLFPTWTLILPIWCPTYIPHTVNLQIFLSMFGLSRSNCRYFESRVLLSFWTEPVLWLSCSHNHRYRKSLQKGTCEIIASAHQQRKASAVIIVLALSNLQGLTMAVTVLGDRTLQHLQDCPPSFQNTRAGYVIKESGTLQQFRNLSESVS